MKSAVVAKLVHQASDFYADAMKLLQLGSIREIWPKVKNYVSVNTEWLGELKQMFTNFVCGVIDLSCNKNLN